MNGKQQQHHFPVHEPKYPGVHVSSEAMRRVCLSAPAQFQGHILGALDENLLARAEALAKPHATPYHAMSSTSGASSVSSTSSHHHHHHPHPHHPLGQTLEGELLEHLTLAAVGGLAPDPPSALGAHQHQLPAVACHLHPYPPHPHPSLPLLPGVGGDSDPRELEAFAERFKQRRVKLGVTQADVGSALGDLRLPGVGSLSQSTICRFESLTLSHNNMLALRPVLQAWLDGAEAAHRDPGARTELLLSASGERRRKRTSITAPEKRSLEAFFSLQPRPSAEKISAIAQKLDLKKNVVRVWFCNQRQKQKRMKYSAAH